jgi:hypothetical protein
MPNVLCFVSHSGPDVTLKKDLSRQENTDLKSDNVSSLTFSKEYLNLSVWAIAVYGENVCMIKEGFNVWKGLGLTRPAMNV